MCSLRRETRFEKRSLVADSSPVTLSLIETLLPTSEKVTNQLFQRKKIFVVVFGFHW